MPAKGYKQSDEAKAKISAKRKLQGNFRTGIKHSKKTKEIMLLKALGNKNGLGSTWNHTEDTKTTMSEIMKERISIKENHPRYIKDRSLVKTYHNKKADIHYKNWSKGVKNRDNWKCKIGDEDCKGILESHHILNWVDHPKLRYDMNNGITLCYFHHPRKRSEERRLAPQFLELLTPKLLVEE